MLALRRTGVAIMPGEFAEVRFLTVSEVATMMRVSKMTVYRLVHSGEMPAVRVGRSFRVPERAVHEYLRHSYVETA
jgi:excisionase family DNA binding protein